MPWVKVETPYTFEETSGKRSLADLFGDKSQLIVYHFMLGPGQKTGCPSCSFIADHFEPSVVHLAARDIAFACVSRAPIAEIEAFKKRMGWTFRWLSSHGSSFNKDQGVTFDENDKGKDYNYGSEEHYSGESPGLSVFARDERGVFHTYSSYARGLDLLIGAYNWIDLTPKGRNEQGLEWPMQWVRHHDSYGKR
jgi:predicted dithiol-disulfide oxidoreductase (DUF899 family)